MLEFGDSLDSAAIENAERVMAKKLLYLLGKNYTLTTSYSEDREAFMVKVRHTPKGAFDINDKYAQRLIAIHDLVHANCDVLTPAIQACIAELEEQVKT